MDDVFTVNEEAVPPPSEDFGAPPAEGGMDLGAPPADDFAAPPAEKAFLAPEPFPQDFRPPILHSDGRTVRSKCTASLRWISA